MKKSIVLIASIGFTICVAFPVMFSCCKRHDISKINVSAAFREYVQAFTSGVISTHSVINVRLTDDFVDSLSLNMPLEKQYFKLKPAVAGKTYWTDSHTIEFRPDKPLPQDQVYTVEFSLSKLVRVPDSLKTMIFSVQTMKQDLSVVIENHKAYTHAVLSKEHLDGTLTTADVAADEQVEKVLEATQNGEKLPITWSHEPRKRLHTFRVDSISRGNSQSEVEIEWNGRPIDSKTTGSSKIEIPALGEFQFLGVRTLATSEQCLVVQFSDPLKGDQNLNGLIRIGKLIDLRYSIDDNELRIYLPEIRENKIKLTLEAAIKNVNRKELGKKIYTDVNIESTAPGIRFVGDGMILPSSNGMLVPFEAVNLKAVDIKVIRIFEKNILQFLQVNDLNSTSELVRVGRVVVKKTIPLKGVSDYGKWNRYSIDLSTLMNAEPGAIYSVILGFNQNYSTFPCSASDSVVTAETDMMVVEDPDSDNEKEWGYYSNYLDDDYSDGRWRNYHWEERNNPCKPSFYFNKSTSRNILASDLGMIAKAGNDGNLHVYITDIITAKPLSGVNIECYNFQLQNMGKSATNKDGMALLSFKKKPFIIVARKDKQAGYLKLTDGTALSLSMFDVSGEPVQKGIKGYIYGERGVWRPGDSLYLTFILEDRSNQLPEHHPVSFSLFNPGGQLVTRMVRTEGTGGFYNFKTTTSPSAPTGNWLVKVSVGGIDFQKTLKIETVKPNRLKINMDFKTDRLIQDKIPPVLLEASWLTGATARNLKALVNLTLTKSKTAFKKYPGYFFDNPTAGFSAENISIFDGRLDESGRVLIAPKIHITHVAPGVLKANFETMVFEDGGDFSIDRFSIPYYPYKSYAGLSVPQAGRGDRVLFTDKTYNIDLLNVDSDGNVVPTNRLKVEVYKLEWRWWWDDSESGSADFISTSNVRPVDSATVITHGGKAVFPFDVSYDDWGRYLIKVTDRSSGHAAAHVVYVDWPDYCRMPGGEKQAASMLTFTSDKERYNVGDKVKLTLPASPDGRALITLESGSKVLKSFWSPTKLGTTEIFFEATEEMAPNCFAYVTLIQPHSQTGNDLPIRLYGVIPIAVENTNTHLKPVIRVNSEFVPGKTANISVLETNGKAMTYTLSIVDEGLLDLTRFKTPDPWNAFYAREALGVKTWDLFDQVIGAYSGDLQRILSIGGDQEGDIKGSLKANRFQPMVKFMGPFELKKGQTRSHNFIMPEYIGSVRVMVVAGKDGAYGSIEKSAKVKKPLMVLGTLPRVLGPGEMVTLPVSVFAMDKTIRNVKIEVEVNELFSLAGGKSHSVIFSEPGDQLVAFGLKVEEATGIGKVHISATCGGIKADQTIEIDIRNPNPRVTDVLEKTIQPEGTWTTAFLPVGIPGTNKGTIELSTIPPLNLEKRLGFLIQYPYGCIEQTTSSAFPQLFLSDLLDLSEESKSKIDRNIRAAIQKIKSFQISNGGLGYWSGAQYADDWGTCYAVHFLLEAETKGYTFPVNTMPALKEYLRQKALSWTYDASYFNDDLMQAYRLYILALGRSAELGAMNRLLEMKNLSVSARWCLASAYQLAGKKEMALQLVNSATMAIKPYRELRFTYGTDLRDKAIIVEALSLLNMKTKATPLVKEISTALCSNEWYSTQTTAYALMAVAKFVGKSEGTGIRAAYRLNAGDPIDAESRKSMIACPIDPKPGGKGTLQVINKGKNLLFARLILQGIPARGDTTETSNNVRLSMVFKTMKGEKISPKQLEQGTNFIAEVHVTNPGILGKYPNMALSQIFPSGWEIINARSSALAENNTAASTFDSQDVRDDRVFTFFELNPSQSKTIRVMLMATYVGRFYFPATKCESMYDHTISASIPGGWIEVVPALK